MIHFAIIHATFREPPTLHTTLKSLHMAGAWPVTVCTDVGVSGAMRNEGKALEYLVRIAGTHDHVCVVDDDMIVHRDALIHLDETLRANPMVPHTLWTIAHSIRHLSEQERSIHGWVDIEPSWADTWGGLVVMHRSIAARVIDHPFWRRYAQTDKVGKHCDVALYETLRLIGCKVRAHIPSLADDVSDGSTTIGTDRKEELRGYRFSELP